MILKCQKDQNQQQHHSATTNNSRTRFLQKQADLQKRNHISGHKMRTTLFTKFYGKMFLECCRDKNTQQHHRARTNICRPSFCDEEAKSQEQKSVSSHKIRLTQFYEIYFKYIILEMKTKSKGYEQYCLTLKFSFKMVKS